MNVKLIILCIVAIGLALILGRWHNQERTRNRLAGKPLYADYTNLPSFIIYLIFIGLILLRYYVANYGGISFK